MPQPNDNGVSSNIIPSAATNLSPSPIVRPFKVQKLSIETPINGGFSPEIPQLDESGFNGFSYDGSRPSNFTHYQFQEEPIHAQDAATNQSAQNQETQDNAPFLYYQESHVEDSVQQCKHSLLGMILTDKPISTQTLHNTLTGIWCKPVGLKIGELEGKKFQIQMEKEEDLQRALKGIPWLIRNSWLILHHWERNIDIQTLDFSHVPLWIQFWGLPLHCKSITMGKEMGSQLGTVLDVGLYEFAENAKTVKVKVNFNVQNPIRAGMYIGNDKYGISWIDFRFENLPSFCFGCGLVGHNIENCRNPHSPFEGGTNPRGAWLRSKTYGKRLIERPEITFKSNALRSISGGQFSPIPRGLLDQMTAININKQTGSQTMQGSSTNNSTHHHSQGNTSRQITTQRTQQMIQHPTTAIVMTTKSHQLTTEPENNKMKRKLGYSTSMDATMETSPKVMAGLINKAS